MATYFTSDLHDGHVNIIAYCHRPFANLEEMHIHLVDSWNSVVTDQDTVYVLGDVCMGIKSINVPNFLKKLKGRKILVRGNHDAKPEKMLEWGFYEVHEKLELDIEGYKVLLRHYPPTDEEQDNYHYCLHGHLHGRYKSYQNCIDVGVDAQGYVPRTFKQLIEGVEPNSTILLK